MPIEHKGRLLCDWCEAQIGAVEHDEHMYDVQPRLHRADFQDGDDVEDVEGVTKGEIMGYKMILECPDCGHPNVAAYGDVVQD